MTWDDALAKIHGFRSLHDDWDGDGSPAPTAEVIQRAIDCVQEMRLSAAPDRVIIGVSGTIYFEWLAHGYAEVEVTEQGIRRWPNE